MQTSQKVPVPGLNGPFLVERLPDWLKHATVADLKRWREVQRPAQLHRSESTTWFSNASQDARQALLDAQKSSRGSARALATALKDFQGLGAFAEPLLKAKLKAGLGVELDVNTTELVEIHYESELMGSMLRLKPRQQSLMQAAMQNFAAGSEFLPGSALAASGAFTLELIPEPEGAYPRFQYRYTSKLDIEPKRFAALCHELDLGGQYQTHLSDIFENPATADDVRTLSINAYKDKLRLVAQIALMKDEISASAQQMFDGLLEGQSAPLLYGKPVVCQALSMFGSSLEGVLVFSANRITSDEVEPIIVYLPGAPLYPLKEYASVKVFKQDLRISLLSPAYRQLFRGFVPKHEQVHFFKLMDDTLLNDGQINYGANLHLRDVTIESELFGFMQDRHLQRIKANARDLAVPSANVDEAAKKARLAYWESIGFNALNAAAFFVPALGVVMAVVAAGQLVNEIIDGAHAWEAGELDEALAHVESVALNVVLAVGLGAAGHTATSLQTSERVEGLVQVTLPGGEQRLWKPDLLPYTRDVQLGDSIADSKGLYSLEGKTYLRIDGQVCEVFEAGDGTWSIRHPDDVQAYQPALKHNNEGTWQVVGEQPLKWSREKLLRRIGSSTHGLPDEVLEQAAQISGVDDDVLRRMHLEQLPVPPLLKDTLHRFQVDRRVSRLIDSFRAGTSDVDGLDMGPSLSLELPRWPQRVLEVYDEAHQHRAPVRYGADRWPNGRVISISVKELYANKLADKVLADLTETEALDLFGSSVEPDKRLDVLRVLIAKRAERHRAHIFKNLYEQGRELPSLEQERLLRDFPRLTDTAALEIVQAGDANERKQLLASGGRVPMRLAEEARLYQRQIVLNQAMLGVYQPSLASLDSDRLALRLLTCLPGWTDTVRLEMREENLSGRVLASAGKPDGELKTLVRRGGRYSAYDAQGLELIKDQEIIVSLLKALPDSERQFLNIDIHATQSLRMSVYSMAVGDRSMAATQLGQQPVRPWFRSPLRLADGRVGYPLGGVVGGLAIDARINALYPELESQELEEMKARMLLENQNLGDVVFQLEAEWNTLQQTLDQWVEDSAEVYESLSRATVRHRLLNAWRRMGRRQQSVLLLNELMVESLPPLTARFEHIRSLNLDQMGLLELPDGFLRCFPRLQSLSLESNPLTAIAPDLGALTGLHHLNLRNISLRTSDTMFEPLRPLVSLRSLELQGNHMHNLPDAALETLATLPALTQLNLGNNRLGLRSSGLNLLARLPLQELDLSSTELVLDEADAQVFSRFVHLQRLQLSSNPLGRVPALENLRQLRYLELDGCRLTEWPTGLTALMNQDPYALRAVDLRRNLITQLPELAATRFGVGLRSNADGAHSLNLYFNPLEADSIARLSMVAAPFEPVIIPPGQPVNVWLQGASKAQHELWRELFQQRRHTALSDMLDRLALSSEFRSHADDVRKRVWSMLQLASQHTQLREELLEIAGDFPVTCGDAGTDAFSALETAVLVFQRSLEATSAERGDELLALYKQLFRRHEVQRMADALSLARSRRRWDLLVDEELTPLDPLDDISDEVLNGESVDDIEIRLALRQQLASVLDYPELSSGMLFRATANVTPRTVERVAIAVIERDTVANRQAWMVDERSWQRYLKQRYSEQFDNLSATWADGLDYLDYCNGASDEVPGSLDSEVLSTLRTALAAEPQAADGTLRKLEIDSQRYLDAVNALANDRNSAETALVAKLTRAQEH